MPDFKVSLAFPHGFGYGAPAGISAVARETAPGNEDLCQLVDDAITHDAHVLVAVDLDAATGRPLNDDGCGDGRAIDSAPGAIYGNDKVFGRSLHRPKVMGGGATMAAAARIGRGDAADEDLGSTFLNASLALQERGIGFGGHTDTSGNDTKSGCGAIDRSVEILQAIGTFHDAITQTIRTLGVPTDGLTAILDNFAADAAQEAYSGRQVSDALVKSYASAVFKRLGGQHQETRIILNMVPGRTVNQALVRDITAERAQTFAVDVWRLQYLADTLYDTAEDRQTALLSMLAYTLGTAAVLTAGDLPVYVISA